MIFLCGSEAWTTARAAAAVLLLAALASCAPFPAEEVGRAREEIETLYYADMPRYLPYEWEMVKDVWRKLEIAEQEKNRTEALRWYFYINQKVPQYEAMLDKRKKEDAASRGSMPATDEQPDDDRDDVQVDDAKPAPQPARETPPAAPASERTAPAAAVEKPATRKKTMDEIRYKLEQRAPSYYTVREGDTIERIAALPNIYNDRYQGMLIYRANRNQIADPHRLYKGQILKIPRNASNDEIVAARREAGATSPESLPSNALTPSRYRKIIEQLKVED